MSLQSDQVGVDLINVTVTYGNQSHALNDISIFIKPGEFVSVLGRNGSGKSTLLRTIAGDCIPSSGDVWIVGSNNTASLQYKRAQYIAHVHQRPGAGLCLGMSVEENCTTALLKHSRMALRDWRRDDRKKRISEAIIALGLPLESKRDVFVGKLSGGEQQMVSLLVAYLQSASILLLDEHTAALDPKQRADVISVTRKFFSTSHATTIMVTHSIREALELSQHILILANGRIHKEYKGFFKWLATERDIQNELSI